MGAIKKCTVCGQSYKYCPGCNQKPEDYYKGSFCSENCRDIFNACIRYNRGVYTAEEAFALLADLDFTNSNNFSSGVKGSIESIMKELDE